MENIMVEENTRQKVDRVFEELEKNGIKYDQVNSSDMTGLGDVVENILTSVGITEERFKSWLNLKKCNCDKRKKWLNNLLSWKRRQPSKNMTEEECQKIRNQIDKVINQLEKCGIKYDERDPANITGLEETLNNVLLDQKIDKESFNKWFYLKNFGSAKRKKWIDNLFSWKNDKDNS